MSDTQTQTQTQASDVAAQVAAGQAAAGKKRLTGVAKMARDFEKFQRIFAINDDEKTDLLNFAGALAETVKNDDGSETVDPGYVDWVDGAPETFTTLALVKSETGDIRAISIPSQEVAFANPAVREYCYEALVSRIMRSARSADALHEHFVTPDGALKISFDKSAWDFQRDDAVASFNGKLDAAGIDRKVNVATLRRCLSDATFAEGLFPKLSDSAWDHIIDACAANAEKKGYDAAILRHWKAIRHLTPEMAEVGDEAFEGFGISASPEKGEEATTS